MSAEVLPGNRRPETRNPPRVENYRECFTADLFLSFFSILFAQNNTLFTVPK